MEFDSGSSQLPKRTYFPRWLRRTTIVVVGLGLWYLSQSLIGSRALSPGDDAGGAVLSRADRLFIITEPVNQFLHNNPAWADRLLILSSAVIDFLGLWLILASILGPTIRPFIGLLILFAARQLMQALCVLPSPTGMIWRYPGVPSIFVTYHVANDFFFSGHTAIAVFGATQIAQVRRRGMLALGVAIALLETSTVIVLRAHYTMDVYAGVITALWAAAVAERVSPLVDRAIA